MLLYENPRPDFSCLEKVLYNQGEPDHVPYIDLFADAEVMEALVGEPIKRDDNRVPASGDHLQMKTELDRMVSHGLRLYDGRLSDDLPDYLA